LHEPARPAVTGLFGGDLGHVLGLVFHGSGSFL
jgi:hypothetical protein